MARLAVFASGNGTNFQSIAEAVARTAHTLCCLVCDKSDAPALDRACRLGVDTHRVLYKGRPRAETEMEIVALLSRYQIDVIALAGFMRLLTRVLIDEYPQRILNIHPALLPKYPGVSAIAESYKSKDTELGITIHLVDYGMDTGPIVRQIPFTRTGLEPIEVIERKLHALEHENYPEVVIGLLDSIDDERWRAS